MNKKIIILIGFFIIIGIGIWVWFGFDSKSNNDSGERTNGLPFGQSEDNQSQAPETTTDQFPIPNTNEIENVPEENGSIKLSGEPVSGAVAFIRGSSTIVRYVEKATGHIYEFEKETNKKTRISNKTIPKIEIATWQNTGNSFVARSAKGGLIESYFISIKPATSTSSDEYLEIEERRLIDNISNINFSSTDLVFYTISSPFEIEGFVANADIQNASSVWKFGTTEWLADWVNNDKIFLNTKASNGVAGYLYSLDTKTGIFKPILSNVPALKTLANLDGNKILFSTSQKNSSELSVFNKDTSAIQRMPFVTFPEKCAWKTNIIIICSIPSVLPTNNMPDSWYQGLVSFSDEIWIYDTDTDASEQISNFKEEVLEVDVINPIISPDNSLLVFTNKKDYTLWAMPMDPNKIPQWID